MFQITIPFLYLVAALAFGACKLRPDSPRSRTMRTAAFLLALAAITLQGATLLDSLSRDGAVNVSLLSSVSLIGLQLAVIGTLAAIDADLRGVSAGLIILAAAASLATRPDLVSESGGGLTWPLQTHVFTAMFAYGLLTAGAIIAIYALVQDHRLRTAKLSALNQLFAPLETTERVLHGVTTVGVIVLAMSVLVGLTFVENLFAQHLVHKTVLSLLALLVFGILIAGRYFAGWRGRRAVYLYLGGFALLCLAYFGSRIVLEVVLGRSWG